MSSIRHNSTQADAEYAAINHEFGAEHRLYLQCKRDLLVANAKAGALKAAITGLLKFHQEGDDGAELPREYWSPGYREAVEHAEALVGSNVEVSGAGTAPTGLPGYASANDKERNDK
jgi:hypothetical protein